MTKREKIKILEFENRALKHQVENLMENSKKLIDEVAERDDKIFSLKSLLEKFKTLNDGTPDDCKRGEWCKACGFTKSIDLYTGKYGRFTRNTVYFCGKGEACANFFQKELNLNDQSRS